MASQINEGRMHYSVLDAIAASSATAGLSSVNEPNSTKNYAFPSSLKKTFTPATWSVWLGNGVDPSCSEEQEQNKTSDEYNAEIARGVAALNGGSHSATPLKEILKENAACGQGVRSLVDGGLVDGTGVANAVATGAKRVISILNIQNPQTDTEGNLDGSAFAPDNNGVPVGLQKFFYLFSDDHRLGNNKIFSQSKAEAKEMYKNFPTLRLAPPSKTVMNVSSASPVLNEIRIGVMNLTTTDNDLYGVEAGSDVELLVISVSSPVGIGIFDMPQLFAQLGQDIISTLRLTYNAEIVTSISHFLE